MIASHRLAYRSTDKWIEVDPAYTTQPVRNFHEGFTVAGSGEWSVWHPIGYINSDIVITSISFNRDLYIQLCYGPGEHGGGGDLIFIGNTISSGQITFPIPVFAAKGNYIRASFKNAAGIAVTLYIWYQELPL